MKLVRTPVPGWTGDVGRVHFVDGVAKVDDNAQELAYFRSAGYGVDDFDEAVDAAVEADDEDKTEELIDLNAQGGTADPDPLVVKEVKDGEQLVLPRKSASAETWRKFAVNSGGLSEEQAAGMTRDELVDHFTDAEEADDTDKEDER